MVSVLCCSRYNGTCEGYLDKDAGQAKRVHDHPIRGLQLDLLDPPEQPSPALLNPKQHLQVENQPGSQKSKGI